MVAANAEGSAAMLDADTLDWNAHAAAPSDRRRPGRTEASTGLVPILRGRIDVSQAANDDFAEDWAPRDPLAPPRGIGLAVAICTPIWIVIGGLLYAFIW